ncbi:MAG: histidine triad nucleotide-binding protein [Brevinematia bacterium]
MGGDCIFCKIVNKEINSKVIYEDDDIIAFEDINPQAPVHFLVVPKKHISNVMELSEFDLVGKVFFAIQKVAKMKGIESEGFRIVINHLSKGGQSVFHLHFHVLGGRQMLWPPG